MPTINPNHKFIKKSIVKNLTLFMNFFQKKPSSFQTENYSDMVENFYSKIKNKS